MKKNNLGVGLIEVLITVLVLSIGLLGVAAMLTSGLRASQGSMERSKANVLADEITERLYSRPGDARCNRYNIALGAAAAGATPAALDLTRWKAHLLADLPGGDGSVACAAAVPVAPCETQNPAVCAVTVQWDDTRAGGVAAQQFTVVSRP
jgi:type IV pilus assembly protein PilV